MDGFIKKHEYNYVRKCMNNLSGAFRNCSDPHTIKATRSYIQDKIYQKFNYLSKEEAALLDMSQIPGPTQIDEYLSTLDDYVYGMPIVNQAQITKLFKKEKKLKLPELDLQDAPIVYLGWIDIATRKLFIVHEVDGQFLGMACRLPGVNSNKSNVCCLCNHIGKSGEVSFVSPVCKTKDNYRSLGFYVCLDSAACNERISSVEKLQHLLKEVNNIK